MSDEVKTKITFVKSKDGDRLFDLKVEFEDGSVCWIGEEHDD